MLPASNLEGSGHAGAETQADSFRRAGKELDVPAK